MLPNWYNCNNIFIDITSFFQGNLVHLNETKQGCGWNSKAKQEAISTSHTQCLTGQNHVLLYMLYWNSYHGLSCHITVCLFVANTHIPPIHSYYLVLCPYEIAVINGTEGSMQTQSRLSKCQWIMTQTSISLWTLAQKAQSEYKISMTHCWLTVEWMTGYDMQHCVLHLMPCRYSKENAEPFFNTGSTRYISLCLCFWIVSLF